MPRGYKWCRGYGRGKRGRPCFTRNISKTPKVKGFIPIESNDTSTFTDQTISDEPLYLYPDELEAMRLVDGENMTQDAAGALMGISRGSIWRLLQSGRKKIITAFFDKREIRIPQEINEQMNETEI